MPDYQSTQTNQKPSYGLSTNTNPPFSEQGMPANGIGFSCGRRMRKIGSSFTLHQILYRIFLFKRFSKFNNVINKHIETSFESWAAVTTEGNCCVEISLRAVLVDTEPFKLLGDCDSTAVDCAPEL